MPMRSPLGPLVRQVYRHELLPLRLRWWFAAAGMQDWLRTLAKGLQPHLGERTRPCLQRLLGRLFDRRYDVLRQQIPALPERGHDPAAQPLLMGALYRLGQDPRARWILGDAAPPLGLSRRMRAQRLCAVLPVEARWREVATHLGELLIVMTEGLPAELPHARRILGEICYQAGLRYAEQVRRFLRLPTGPDADGPALAIEVLRMGEYIFHVNPKHWGGSDGQSGWLEGTACLWYPRPGWTGAHCGIFGQFQAGISAAFGLRYHLAQTIPKHGGSTCRVDLKPLRIRVPSDA